jgi:hypothetical protein
MRTAQTLRRLSVFTLSALLVLAGSPASAAPSESPVVGAGSILGRTPVPGYSPRVSVYSGYCLDQHFNANNQPTNTVYAWPDCHLQSNQWWSYSDSTYPYPIRNLRSGWCLEHVHTNGSPTTSVQARPCTGQPNQRWEYGYWSNGSPGFVYLNWRSHWCLDQHTVNDGPTVEVWAWPCHWADNQLWEDQTCPACLASAGPSRTGPAATLVRRATQ